VLFRSQGLAQRFGFGGGGPGGGTAPGGRFVERPGETVPRVPGAPGGAGPAGQQAEGGEGAAGGAGQPDATFLGTLGDLIRVALPGQRPGGGGGGFRGLAFVAQAFGRAGGGGFGGFGGGAPAVESGDYLVSITVDGKTLSRVLRVDRVNGTGADAGFGFDDESSEP